MELQVTGVQTIPSYEVAGMMGRSHAKVIRMLEGDKSHVGIIPTLTEAQLGVSDYFIEGTYKDASGKQNKYYECTKMGCELLANKMTGEKGILFTAKYVNKFNDMEQQLKYSKMDSYMIEDPVARATRWIEEHKEKQLIEEQKKLIEEKHDNLVHTSKTYTTTEIAKELGFKSATALNKDLESKKLQYKMNGTWVLAAKFSENGFVSIKQNELKDGRIIYNRRWTGKGRDWLVNEIYKK
jgi:phage regulator Rha-like protein